MSHQFKLIMSCTFQHSLANLRKTMKYMHAFVCIFFLMKNHEYPMLKNDILVNSQSILTYNMYFDQLPPPPPFFCSNEGNDNQDAFRWLISKCLQGINIFF